MNKVGQDYKVQDGYVELNDIGGYKLCLKDNNLCIQGSTLVNLSEMPITPVSIRPIVNPILKYDDVEIIKDKVYVIVELDTSYYIFKHLKYALALANVITFNKLEALKEKFKK